MKKFGEILRAHLASFPALMVPDYFGAQRAAADLDRVVRELRAVAPDEATAEEWIEAAKQLAQMGVQPFEVVAREIARTRGGER